MASPGAVRSGRGEVELGLDQSQLVAGLNSAKKTLQSFGSSVAQFGSALLGTGLAIGAMFLPGIVAAADFEQAFADLKAAANPTVDQLESIRSKITEVAKATGIGPVEVTKAFGELLKAGKTVDQVIGGLGETVIKFARVSGIGMVESAVALSDALNVFGHQGIDAAAAANIMNQAADASTISLKDVVDAFASGGSVAALFGQSMLDTATAIGIMGNAGIKGATAGTALKTMLMRLATGVAENGTDEVAEGMRTLGLTVRDAEGKMLPLPELIARIKAGADALGPAAADIAIKQIAGARGILGLAPLLRGGMAGFLAFQNTMATALTVEQKFAVMTDTLWGALAKAWVHVQLVAIAIGDALLPALTGSAKLVLPILDGLAKWITLNQDLVQMLAFDAVRMIAVGAALMALGTLFYVVGTACGILATAWWVLAGTASFVGSAIAFAFSPIGLAIIAVVIAVALVIYYFDELSQVVTDLWAAFLASPIAGFLANLLKAYLVFQLVIYVIIGVIAYLGYLAAAFVFDKWLIGVKLIWSAFVWLMARLGEFYAYVFGLFAKLVDPIVRFADSILTTLGTAFSSMAAGFTDMFASIVATGTQAFGILKSAFMAGDWALIWETVKVSAMLMWNELSFFLTATFNSWKDALGDVFSSLWVTMQVGFFAAWGAMIALMLNDLARVMDGMASVTIGPASDLLTLGAAELRGQALDARVGAGQMGRNILAQAAEDAAVAGFLRELRDERLAEGRVAAAAPLQQRLDFMSADAESAAFWTGMLPDDQLVAAELRRWRDEAFEAGDMDLARGFQAQLGEHRDAAAENEFWADFRNQGPGGPEPFPDQTDMAKKAKDIIIGSFSSQALFGMLGAGAQETPAARQNRLMQTQLDLMREELGLLRQIVGVAGARRS